MMETHAKFVNRKTTKRLTVVAPNLLFVTAAFASIRTGVSEVNMADGTQKDWRELCTAVVNETDFNKLSSLVQKLVEALDEGRPNRRPRMDSCGKNLESA